MTNSPNTIPDQLLQALNDVLRTKGKPPLAGWSPTQAFVDAPLEFDSLDLAQLSIALEERLGKDPYSAGEMPRSLGDLLGFYTRPLTP